MRCMAVLLLSVPLLAQAPTLRPLFADFETAANCEQPQLAVRADGALALVFAAPGPSVRLAIRLPEKDWQTPLMVARMPDLAVGRHRGPRVAWAGNALVVACIESRWDARAKQSLGSGNLTVRRSTDLGAHWSAPVDVNGEHGSAREGLHALAAAGDRVALVWLDPRGEPKASRLWCALSQDGGQSFGKDFAAWPGKGGPICPCCHPSLCLDGSGRAVALWRDAIDGNRDLYTGTITDGKAISAPQAAGSLHWKLDACPMDGGGLGLAADGTPVSVWRRDDAIFWAHAGREHRLGQGRNPALAVAGTAVLAAWESGNVIVAARFDAAHPDRKAELRELGAGAYAAVAALPGGKFLVVAEVPAGERTRIGACEL
jgi:hypothetical protein